MMLSQCDIDNSKSEHHFRPYFIRSNVSCTIDIDCTVYVNFLINKFYKHFYLYNLYNFVLLEIFDIILYGSSVRLYGSSVAKVVVTKQPAKSMYYLAVVISFPKLPRVLKMS